MSSERAVITVDGLIKTYDLLPVLRKLSLSVQRGEFLALLGPNGSGKSTLLRLLAGLSKPTMGSISIGGWSLPKEVAAVRAQIGMVSHKPLLYDNLTAYENLDFFARLYHVPPEQRQTRINDLLARIGLSKHASALTRTFSRGMTQRLSIARALLHNPHILLFDEPHTGLDQDAAAVLDTLLAEAHHEGRTILMTTHELDRAVRVTKRVVILSRGVIVYDSPTEGLTTLQLAAAYTEATGTASTR